MAERTFTRPLTVLIDGPSGAGKSWLASYLRARWRASRTLAILHMDDVYPGWSGLELATDFLEQVVVPARAAREPVRWQRFDWSTQQPAEWNEIPASVDLIIEGCGCLTQRTAEIADLSVWINTDEAMRKQWALSRGDEDYERHWNHWDIQFRRFRDTHTPERYASLVLRSTR